MKRERERGREGGKNSVRTFGSTTLKMSFTTDLTNFSKKHAAAEFISARLQF